MLHVGVLIRYRMGGLQFCPVFLSPLRTQTQPSPQGRSVILLSDNASPRLRSGIYMKLLIVCSSNSQPGASSLPEVKDRLFDLLPLYVQSDIPPLTDQHDKALAGAESLGTDRFIPPRRTSRPSTWLPQKWAAEFFSQRRSAVELTGPILALPHGSDASPAAAALGGTNGAPRTPHRRHGIHE